MWWHPDCSTVSADRSHALAHAALRWILPWRMLSATSQLVVDDPGLKTKFAGIELPNPVGLRGRFLTKTLNCSGRFPVSGSGFICVGSIMPEPRYWQSLSTLGPLPRPGIHRRFHGRAGSKGPRGYAVARACSAGEKTGYRSSPMSAVSRREAIAAGVLDVQPYADIVEISLDVSECAQGRRDI